jgi:hypothetical protein
MIELFTDIKAFVNALRKHWGSLVTGGMAIGLLGTWQNTGHAISPWIYWAIALLGFFGACFFAWRDETRKTEEHRLKCEVAETTCLAEIKRNSVPEFELELGQIRYFYTESVNLTSLLISCRITNHGAASPAWGWVATLRKPSGQETVGTVHFPGPVYYWPLDESKALELHKSNMLPAITAELIPSGGSKLGRVLFEFAGDVRHDMIWGAATLHVGCTDRTNRETWKDFGKGYPAQEATVLPDEQVIDTRQLQLSIDPSPA